MNGLSRDEAEGSPKDQPVARKGGRSSRRGFVVAATVGAVCVVLAAGFGPQLWGVYTLRPWDQSGPRDALDAFAAAVRARDMDAVQAIAPGVDVSPGFETMLTPRAKPRQPALAPDEQIPVSGVDSAQTHYDYELGEVKLMASTAQGRVYTYHLGRRGGRWVLLEWGLTPRRRP